MSLRAERAQTLSWVQRVWMWKSDEGVTVKFPRCNVSRVVAISYPGESLFRLARVVLNPPRTSTATTMTRRGKELDPQTRSRICELKLQGWSYTRLSERFPDIPVGTMKSTVRRESARENNVTKPRPGAPKKLTEDDLARIKQRILEDPHVTIKDLLAVVDFKCHRRSIQRLLQTDEMRKGQQHQPPDIKPKETKKPPA